MWKIHTGSKKSNLISKLFFLLPILSVSHATDMPTKKRIRNEKQFMIMC